MTEQTDGTDYTRYSMDLHPELYSPQTRYLHGRMTLKEFIQADQDLRGKEDSVLFQIGPVAVTEKQVASALSQVQERLTPIHVVFRRNGHMQQAESPNGSLSIPEPVAE